MIWAKLCKEMRIKEWREDEGKVGGVTVGVG